MASEQLHEAAESLRAETREMHRAITSLMEELEAVDWYAQRVDAAGDEELAAVLTHNMNEEKEHAAMVLEWIRRRDAKFDQYLRRYLFTSGPIEDESDEPADGGDARAAATRGGTLRIGSLRVVEASE